jgi:hypothetical protein
LFSLNEERFILAWSTIIPKWAFKFTVYLPGSPTPFFVVFAPFCG